MSFKSSANAPGRANKPWIAVIALLAVLLARAEAHSEPQPASKDAYIQAVARGTGWMPWQQLGVSVAEEAFRAAVEARKSRMLDARAAVKHPVLLGAEALERARRNIATADWARAWFERHLALADYLIAQPDGYVEAMIPELTPTNPYGFTCPNCVGRLSQEGTGASLIEWNYREPDTFRCRRCGQVYPDARFPEDAELKCPRSGQTLTFYRNDLEREHADDRSGRYAWHWVGHPIHVSFSGLVREKKVLFMLGGLSSLCYAYGLTGEPRYAEQAVAILQRLAYCYRGWMYHDYWDTFADCDPLYAAWHDRELPLTWKRHLCEEVYEKDSLERAHMMQSYWGAGRVHPSTGAISAVAALCLAYDLVHDARDADGDGLWTEETRARVERDLLLEWVIEAEPFVGGEGKAETVNNKSPRVYHAMAAIAQCLGLAEYADTALRGYEGLRDKSFLYDGFSKESPGYTNMYLGELIRLTERLQGFTWPEGHPGRAGAIDLYGTDPRLRLMLRAVVDQVDGEGQYLPLSDTPEGRRPNQGVVEVGLRRYPEYYEGKHRTLRGEAKPGEYAVFQLDGKALNTASPLAPPELLFPAWMTAILRHGVAPEDTVLALCCSPPGGHRHDDNLDLYYKVRGAPILDDLGYVGDMPVNRWMHSALSHNLVVVDDSDQLAGGAAPRVPRIELMATSPVLSVVEASSRAYAQCDTYRRLVILLKGPEGRTLVVDIFRVSGGEKHAYRVFSGLAASDSHNGSLTFNGLDLPLEPPLPETGQSLAHEDVYGLRDVRAAATTPSRWQAVWAEEGRCYRLWMLSQVDTAQAANGPGQTTRENAGRRVRCVNAVREGTDLTSTFVAVHEPDGRDGKMPIACAERLDTPHQAGPDAVAIRVETDWGTYWILNEFTQRARIGAIHFDGRLGVVCHPREGTPWALGLGARTLKHGALGFRRQVASWRSSVRRQEGRSLVSDVRRPRKWPVLQEGFTNYLLAFDGSHQTAFPVRRTQGDEIELKRFSPPDLAQFELYALRYVEWEAITWDWNRGAEDNEKSSF